MSNTARELQLLDLTKRILKHYTNDGYEFMKELSTIEKEIEEGIPGPSKEGTRERLEIAHKEEPIQDKPEKQEIKKDNDFLNMELSGDDLPF
jgi:hypothetical protein